MWRNIACPICELKLDLTLACGQSFRWVKHAKSGEWRSVLAGRIFALKQNDTHIEYQVLSRASPSTEADEGILRDYLQLHIKISDLYGQWSSVDSNFEEVAKSFTGIRMLRQDPLENLFAFICSSNNHISRISGMVEKMCVKYGSKVGDVEGQAYYSFPTVESLAHKQVEADLRELGFGYRAKYIQKSAEMVLAQGGESWLHGLRSKPYEEAKTELRKLNGVGAKVADCVLLMSLDKPGAIPVDTHVWQIASRDYMPHLKDCKSVTDRVYYEIGVFFRELWGPYAGWAHSVLFAADLRKFKDLKEDSGKVAKKRSRKEEKVKAKKKKTK